MESIRTYFKNLTKLELIVVAGFMVITLAIPLGMVLVKSFISNNSSNLINQYKIVTQPKEVPADSPLDQLRKILGQPSPTPQQSITSQGPTLSLKIQMQGRPNDQESAKIFIGIAQGQTTQKPKFLLTFLVDIPSSGEFQGISLAGLELGETYTAYIKGPGQIDSSVSFVMGSQDISLNNNQPILLLSGDLNDDNIIDLSDQQILNSLYGATSSSNNWNPYADFNHDGVVNSFDGLILTSNLGKTGVSGPWVSTPYPSAPTAASTSASLNIGGVEESTTSGGYWLYIPAFKK